MNQTLRTHLLALCQFADARVAAVFLPGDTRPPRLLVQEGLDQEGYDVVHAAWAERRESLERGIAAHYGPRVVRPVTRAGRLVGLLHMDREPAGLFDHPEARRLIDQIAEWLAAPSHGQAVVRRLAQYDPRETLRQQLEAGLTMAGGNITALAEVLGVERQTIYNRARKLGIDFDTFRFRPRRRKTKKPRS
jgi:hypothetical protein